jgi:hypothetical protein
MVAVVAPVLHKYVPPVAVRVLLGTAHVTVAGDADAVAVGGVVLATTLTLAVEEHPVVVFVTVTV